MQISIPALLEIFADPGVTNESILLPENAVIFFSFSSNPSAPINE